MKRHLIWFIVIFFWASCKDDKDNGCNYDGQTVNSLQYLGSHNSYRTKTYQPIFDAAINLHNTGVLPDDLNPNEWDYTHVPLVEQLEQYNMRSFELDVYYDPDGGRYYDRAGNLIVFEPTASEIPELQEPGYKIIHIPDLDYNTHHYTFKDALQTLKGWSDTHPDHEPIFILVELKDAAAGDYVSGFNFAEALPYTEQAMEDLDTEMKDVFGANLDKIITPDDFRRGFSSIEEAALAGQWPTLGDSKGKFYFIFMGNNDSKTNYTANHPNLEGRAMFYFTDPGDPNCAFIKYDNPLDAGQQISEAVSKGYMVRTRADAGTWEARSGDTAKREAAFNSGAQIISTDYYLPDSRHVNSAGWTDYSVQFPEGGAFQVNTVISSFDCPE